MITIIENGDVYAPEPRGVQTILLANEQIEKIDGLSRRALDALGCEYELIDASDCYVTPGIIDPHAYLASTVFLLSGFLRVTCIHVPLSLEPRLEIQTAGKNSDCCPGNCTACSN